MNVHVWKIDVFMSPLRERGRKTRETLFFEDIDYGEFERRCAKCSGDNQAVFERFAHIWQSDVCRRAFVPRAIIAAEEGFSVKSAASLALVWTLGAGADTKALSRGDLVAELLLDIGATLLLFAVGRRILRRVDDLARSAGLCVADWVQPEDAAGVRRVFGMPSVRGMIARDMKGVSLNSHGLIVPAKSNCAVAALGPTPAPASLSRPCASCGEGGCMYGQMDFCPRSFFGEV